jgi:hypothetical protein
MCYVQARHESNLKKNELWEKHSCAPSFKPDIGVNAFKEVEPDKDKFFQRLFDYRHYQKDLSKAVEYNTKVLEMGRDVRADPVLNPAATQRLLERLTVADTAARKDRALYRSSVINSALDTSSTKFINKKSHAIANKSKKNALSEIFDVLLMSVRYSRHHDAVEAMEISALADVMMASAAANNLSSTTITTVNPLVVSLNLVEGSALTVSDFSSSCQQGLESRPTPSSDPNLSASSSSVAHQGPPTVNISSAPSLSTAPASTETINESYLSRKGASKLRDGIFKAKANHSTDEALLPENNDTLEIRMARPNLLSNPNITSAMITVLSIALKSGYEKLSRQEFLLLCGYAIENSFIPPLNFILSSINRGKQISEHSDVLAAKKCTPLPTDLPAKRRSEKLVAGRYKHRISGEQKIEDSLQDCKSFLDCCKGLVIIASSCIGVDLEYKLVRSSLLRKRLIDEEMHQCTFAPQLVTGTSWDMAKQSSGRQRQREQYFNQIYDSQVLKPGSGSLARTSSEASFKSAAVSSVSLSMRQVAGSKSSSQPSRMSVNTLVQDNRSDVAVDTNGQSPSQSIISLRESIKKFTGATQAKAASKGKVDTYRYSAGGKNISILPVKQYSKSYFDQNGT